MVKLGELCQFVSGGTPRRDIEKYYTGDMPWITGADIVDDRIQEPRCYITQEAIENSATNIVPAGNILLVTRTGVGKVAINEQDICISQDFTGLIPDRRRVDIKYLYHFLRNSKDYFIENQRGATIKGVTREVVKNLEVPLPYPSDPARSLAEQRRIVARLEALLGEVREMRKLQATIEADVGRLMEAALGEVFPDISDEAQVKKWGWEIYAIEEISTPPQYGYTASAHQEPIGPKFLRITDIQDGFVDWDTVPHCKIQENQIAKYELKSGDIVFARSGATTGKTYLITNPPKAVFASYLIRIRIQEKSIPEYVFWFFQSPQYWKQITLRGGAQPNMNAQLLKQVCIPIPYPADPAQSMAEQHRIVARLDAVQAEVNAARRLAAHDRQALEQLEQSILAAAFRGEMQG